MLLGMLATGVDLSAEHPKTWLASINFLAAGANLVSLEGNVANERIVASAASSRILGIDCPFGWPVAFLDFVGEHMHGDVAPRNGPPIEWRRRVAYRETDRFVIKETGLRPLSVAADRIGHVAMRCAALLAELRQAGIDVDRSGISGQVVEVYPAASLLRWGLTNRGYKRVENASNLDGLVTALRAAAPWLNLGEYESTCRANDDAFDAVIAALSAAAASAGLTTPPIGGTVHLARREGWVAIPNGHSLAHLLEATAASRQRADIDR